MKSGPRQARAQDFRLYLQSELSRRAKENSSYSLRAFAKLLEVDPSALAKLLKGDRPLGPRLISRFGKSLGLAPDEIREFLDAREHARSRAPSRGASVPEYQQITLDTFRIISDWHHYAILELIRVDSFRPDSRWISSALGIPVNEVNFAVERMVRSGLLEITAEGKWLDLSEVSTNLVKPYFTDAQRKHQKQLLEKAIYALEHVPVARRDQTSITMAIDSERLGEAKERIKQFRRELAQFLSRGEKRDQVYQLAISLYPLSDIKENRP
ncbi:MAG: TIGR02147 family protein [Oligoflexia bacterium]|nr:TIGR02147 family protein [Oligoflexia bacterium]